MLKVIVVSKDNNSCVAELSGVKVLHTSVCDVFKTLRKNMDAIAVVFDGCMDVDRDKALEAVIGLCEVGFRGRLIAAAELAEDRQMLCLAGCSVECETKAQLPALIREQTNWTV